MREIFWDFGCFVGQSIDAPSKTIHGRNVIRLWLETLAWLISVYQVTAGWNYCRHCVPSTSTVYVYERFVCDHPCSEIKKTFLLEDRFRIEQRRNFRGTENEMVWKKKLNKAERSGFTENGGAERRRNCPLFCCCVVDCCGFFLATDGSNSKELKFSGLRPHDLQIRQKFRFLTFVLFLFLPEIKVLSHVQRQQRWCEKWKMTTSLLVKNVTTWGPLQRVLLGVQVSIELPTNRRVVKLSYAIPFLILSRSKSRWFTAQAWPTDTWSDGATVGRGWPIGKDDSGPWTGGEWGF